MTATNRTIIFTDLDGTLLDHDTYSWSAAEPALALARQLSVPVIPCTSKTFEECLETQQQISLKGPFIFENGSGIALPKTMFPKPIQRNAPEVNGYWLIGLGIPYEKIRYQLLELRRRRRYQFRGFGDMSVDQVCEATGLGEHEASQAMRRRYSEPLMWLDDAKTFDQFASDVDQASLSMTRGGRFVHVAGSATKGKAMLWMGKLYSKILGESPELIALGDSMNDIPMLKEAHIAVIIRPRHRNPISIDKPRTGQEVITTEGIGPEGWNEAITTILRRKESSNG